MIKEIVKTTSLLTDNALYFKLVRTKKTENRTILVTHKCDTALKFNNMKPDEAPNQSNSAQEAAQRQKEQEEQRKKNWRPRSEKEIYLLEKMGMRIRVGRPDSESEK